jgi:hypothetical protein
MSSDSPVIPAGLHPLNSPQREIWFDQMLHPDVPLYNFGGYVEVAPLRVV